MHVFCHYAAFLCDYFQVFSVKYFQVKSHSPLKNMPCVFHSAVYKCKKRDLCEWLLTLSIPANTSVVI